MTQATELVSSLLAGTFLFGAVLCGALSVPLIRGRVAMNRWYGVRIGKAFRVRGALVRVESVRRLAAPGLLPGSGLARCAVAGGAALSGAVVLLVAGALTVVAAHPCSVAHPGLLEAPAVAGSGWSPARRRSCKGGEAGLYLEVASIEHHHRQDRRQVDDRDQQQGAGASAAASRPVEGEGASRGRRDPKPRGSRPRRSGRAPRVPGSPAPRRRRSRIIMQRRA